MSIIVSDLGFAPDDWAFGFQQTVDIDMLTETSFSALALDLSGDFDVARLTHLLDRIDLIRIGFPTFTDGRGFSQAQQLRLLGFQGRLRAMGHILSDQYPMARRSGFDEVEISAELAARQPEPQWLAQSQWSQQSYQRRLRQFD